MKRKQVISQVNVDKSGTISYYLYMRYVYFCIFKVNYYKNIRNINVKMQKYKEKGWILYK